MIYLDNAATTKIDSRVLDVMLPFLTEQYGNAGTLYKLGRESADAIAIARSQVAKLIGAKPSDIIFTSGGSEANNMVFQGVKEYLRSIGKTHIVISATEHDSVINSAKALIENDIKREFGVQFLPVNIGSGVVNISKLADMIENDKQLGLVSIMFVNNETGVINPVHDIGKLCRDHNILFHTDCVQATGCQNINVDNIQCDFLSLSSHKIHGTKGCGALYCRNQSILQPMIYGGTHQEFGLRAGTENIYAIVGFGKACELLQDETVNDVSKIIDLKHYLYNEIIRNLSHNGINNITHINGGETKSKILNLCFDNVDGETLLLMLDSIGVCVSAGSACRSHESEPSRVLLAMGLEPEQARNSIRLSLSRMNTDSEIFDAAKAIADSVTFLYNPSIL